VHQVWQQDDKNKHSHDSSITLFEDLMSSSLEVFALLLCKNGHESWVWMCNNACTTATSEGEDTEEECPGCKHTKRTRDFTSRNGGWSKVGMNLHKSRWTDPTPLRLGSTALTPVIKGG
jgi:hypothetical protein